MRPTLNPHPQTHTSHPHQSDHTCGLRPSFTAGTIYCSEATAALVVGKLGVHPQFVEALPLRAPRWIQVGGICGWICISVGGWS